MTAFSRSKYQRTTSRLQAEICEIFPAPGLAKIPRMTTFSRSKYQRTTSRLQAEICEIFPAPGLVKIPRMTTFRHRCCAK